MHFFGERVMGTLTIKNLRVGRDSFQIFVKNISVQSGSILGVVGKSGSGKSTLLNAIAGFETLSEGEIHFNDTNLSSLPPEQRRIAIVFQRPALFPHLTVLGNVCFGLKIKKQSESVQKELAIPWLKKLGIADLADRYPHSLSGGEAQRVAIARALVVGFPILLLDEPFSGLDVELKSGARKALKELVDELKLAAILVSHDPTDIEELADEVCTLEKGQISGWLKKKS